MSAAVLREAAALMRSRAEAADSTGAWEVGCRYSRGTDWIRPVYDDDGTVAEIHEGDADEAPESCEALATHIASWHPAVALDAADWLDDIAEWCESVPVNFDNGSPNTRGALAVARTYLGTADTKEPA